jgi:hypothetical protein
MPDHLASGRYDFFIEHKNGCTTRPFICWLTPLIRMRFSIFTCSGVPAGNTRGTIWLDAGIADMK